MTILSKNAGTRRSFVANENAELLCLGLQALEQIRKFKCSYLFRNGIRSGKLTSLRHVSNFLGLPYVTLYKHQPHVKAKYLKKTSFGTGPGCHLGAAAEAELKKYITWMDERGFPLGWRAIRIIAHEIGQKYGLAFEASSGWVRRFKRRHPDLTTRIAQSLERTRVGGMNPDTIQRYFDLLEKVKEEIVEANGGAEFADDLIYNLDETGIDQLSAMKDQVVTFRRKKLGTYVQSSSDRTHLSALTMIRGDGWRSHTMYAVKGKVRMVESLPNCPVGTEYVMTEKGYFDEPAFFAGIKFLVNQLPTVEADPRWRLLVLDGYGPHTMMPEVLDYLFEHRIHSVCLPSHTSQILQPLDVSCLGPTKKDFRIDLRETQFIIGVDGVSKWELPGVFEYALERGCSISNVISGFISCGLIKQSQFSTTWVQRNLAKLTISEQLSEERAKATEADPKKCSYKATATIARESKEILKQSIELPGVPTPTKASLSLLIQRLDEQLIPVTQRFADIMHSPPKPQKRKLIAEEQEDGSKFNCIGEPHHVGKWLTETKRRERVRSNAKAIADRKEEREHAAEERCQQRRAAQALKDAETAKKDKIRLLLVQHRVLGTDGRLTKAMLTKFFQQNKAQIQKVIREPFPKLFGDMLEWFHIHLHVLSRL